MKLLAAILFPFMLHAQKDLFITKNDAIVYALQYVAGAANGEHDRILFHPNAFFIDHPNLNRTWWDPRISWHNKYSRSWVVQNIFVFVTDENHASPAVEHTSFIFSFAISYNDVKKNWQQIIKSAIKRCILAYGFNRAGFHSFYR